MSEFDFNKEGFTPENEQKSAHAAYEAGEKAAFSAPRDTDEILSNGNGTSDSVFTSAADSIERSVNNGRTENTASASNEGTADTPASAGEYTYAFKGDQLPNNSASETPRAHAYGNSEQYVPFTGPAGTDASRSFTQNSASGAQNGTPYTNSFAGYGAPNNGGYNPQGTSYTYGGQNANNGGYGYRPPFNADSGAQNSGGYANTDRPEPPRPPHGGAAHKQKHEKKKGTLKTSTAIMLCVACVLLSFASGILGSALIYNAGKTNISDYELSEGDIENGGVAGVTDNGAVVLYRAVETVKEDGSDMTVAEVANTVSDSVVEITTEFVSTDNFFFGQYVSEGAGSGVIISEDGYIVTNNHVISDTSSGDTASKITVRLRSGEEYEASLVGKDADSDVAVLKIESDNLKAAVWGDSDELVVGQQVIAVGNPLGELGGTVTTGIVSASDREVQIDNVMMTLIQIDAAVNPGNSGGGLFNTKGELIGIVNAKSSGSGIEGLGFAIPSNDAYDITTQLLEHGYVSGKVYLGVSFYEANSGYYSSDSESILYVYATEKGYNDDVLQSKDIVLSIDGEEVSTAAEVKAILKKHQVGDTLTFSILRGKAPMEVEVTCYEAKPIGSSVSIDD